MMLYESIIKKIHEADNNTNIDKLTDIINKIKDNPIIKSQTAEISDEAIQMSNITAYLLAAGFLSGVVLGGGKNKSLKFKHMRKNKSIKLRSNKKGGFNIDGDDIEILKKMALNIIKDIIIKLKEIIKINTKIKPHNSREVTEITEAIDLFKELFKTTQKVLKVETSEDPDTFKDPNSFFKDDTNAT